MDKTLKILITIVIAVLLILFVGNLASIDWYTAPSIEKIEEDTASDVEDLLTEDNNEMLSLRLDRYFLDERVDELTYKGSLKATALYMKSEWDFNKHKFVDIPDSVKFYRTVIIKFRDKKYDSYSISISEQ